MNGENMRLEFLDNHTLVLASVSDLRKAFVFTRTK